MISATTQAIPPIGDTDERYTPRELIDVARLVLGEIDLDPASCAAANRIVGATRYYDKALGGLDHPWHGRIWLNPPYSNPRPWIERLIVEYERHTVTQALLLLNTATGTTSQQKLLRSYPCCLLAGRLDFSRPDGSTEGRNRYEQVLFYLGRDVDWFCEILAPYGAVLLPASWAPPVVQGVLL